MAAVVRSMMESRSIATIRGTIAIRSMAVYSVFSNLLLARHKFCFFFLFSFFVVFQIFFSEEMTNHEFSLTKYIIRITWTAKVGALCSCDRDEMFE